MVRIAIDAGHGYNTAGKRTPDGEREWTFNDKVARAAIARLNTYGGVEILRVDDPTGKVDIPLATRTNRANAWKADVYVSLHHNALIGTWGAHGGVETFTFNGENANSVSQRIAAEIHPRVLSAMGISNRGIKKANFHVLRETKMPAILVEGGFMDSLADILALRNDAKLAAQGEAVADGLAAYYKLKPKVDVEVTQVSAPKTPTVSAVTKPKAPATTAKAPYDLRFGDTGALVTALQTDLNKLGYKLAVDGSFGPAVETAVKAFQRKYGLTADGIFGPASQRKLAEVLKPAPVPKPVVKPAPAPTKTTAPQTTGDVYRVIVDGKQVGAYGVPDNVADAVTKALRGKAKDVRIQKV